MVHFKNIFYFLTFCCFAQAMQTNNKFNNLFFDFDEKKDAEFLEYLFKTDYSMLVTDHQQHPYYSGKGVETFKNCVSDAKINERKILRIDNQSVAFVIFFIAQNSSFKHLQDGNGVLALMGVHPDYRRKGYGSIIMRYLTHRFEELNCEQGWLSVNENNSSAQNLYTKFDFSNTKTASWGDSQWWVLNIKNKQDK